jgi:hypothetical protein
MEKIWNFHSLIIFQWFKGSVLQDFAIAFLYFDTYFSIFE